MTIMKKKLKEVFEDDNSNSSYGEDTDSDEDSYEPGSNELDWKLS